MKKQLSLFKNIEDDHITFKDMLNALDLREYTPDLFGKGLKILQIKVNLELKH